MLLKLKLLRFYGHQEWIRFILRDKILRLFVNPDKCASHEFEADFFGMRYKGNLNRYLDWCIYFFGAYEKQQLLLLGDLINKRGPDSVFLDVGANTGEYSLYLSKKCKQVHAFEPYDVIAKIFREEISMNKIENITVHELGLSNENNELDFYAPDKESHNTGTGSFLSIHEAENNRLYKKIKVANADEYIGKLNLQRIDLIKIDVEGFEKNVLKGLQNTIKKYRPIIFMEYSKTTAETFSSSKEFQSLVADYRISRVIANMPLFLFFNKPIYRLGAFSSKDVPANLLLEPE
jgi:FkbM family methyltransferase